MKRPLPTGARICPSGAGWITCLLSIGHMYEHNAPLEHRETYAGTVHVPFGLPLRDYHILGAPSFRRDKNRPVKDRFDLHNSLPKTELYDLAAAPSEAENIACSHPGEIASLNRLLKEHIAQNPRRWIENAEQEQT